MEGIVEEVDLLLKTVIQEAVYETDDDACDQSTTNADAPSCHLEPTLDSCSSTIAHKVSSSNS